MNRRFRHIFVKILYGTLFLYLFQTEIADSQTTPFDEYANVNVPDTAPVIPSAADKIYTTTINIVKQRTDNTFQATNFEAQAESFYSPLFQGFQSVTVTDNTNVDDTTIKVTYDVSYAYPVLRNDVNGSDARITDTIGSFEFVKLGLETQPLFFAVFRVQDDATQFTFAGSAMCSQLICNGTYVECVESTAGVSATCQSQCKSGYCLNEALCSQTDADIAPFCTCPVYPDLWVLGTRCETKIALWLVILLSVIGFLIILLVIIIVCICVIKRRRRRKRKEELANTVLPTRAYNNNGFVPDKDRPTTNAVPPVSLVARSNPASTVEREDSFDTTTDSDHAQTERSYHRNYDRRSNATSRSASTHHSHHHSRHHHDRHGDRHHHHRHRDHHHHHRRHRSRSSERHATRPPPIASSESSSEEEEEEEESDEKNLSFYEIDVGGLESGDAASSVAPSTVNTSPIRWLPPRGAETRPGWVPSLGPMMYQLPTSNGNVHHEDELPAYEAISHDQRSRDTDI